MTTTYQRATFSNMRGRTISLTAPDWDAAQALADHQGRQGWLLVDIEEERHTTTLHHAGATIFESNYGLSAKRAWVWTCTCGDEDATHYKADATREAKLHTGGTN